MKSQIRNYFCYYFDQKQLIFYLNFLLQKTKYIVKLIRIYITMNMIIFNFENF